MESFVVVHLIYTNNSWAVGDSSILVGSIAKYTVKQCYFTTKFDRWTFTDFPLSQTVEEWN